GEVRARPGAVAEQALHDRRQIVAGADLEHLARELGADVGHDDGDAVDDRVLPLALARRAQEHALDDVVTILADQAPYRERWRRAAAGPARRTHRPDAMEVLALQALTRR